MTNTQTIGIIIDMISVELLIEFEEELLLLASETGCVVVTGMILLEIVDGNKVLSINCSLEGV